MSADAGSGVPARTRINVLIVEDQELVADALTRLLAEEPDITVVGVAGSVAATHAPVSARPDVVLMDYRLPDGTGAEATRVVKARWPAARVLMLTGYADQATSLDAIRAGADGFLTKDRAVAEVVGAVRAAKAGEVLLPRWVTADLARQVAAARDHPAPRQPVAALTARELEVLKDLVAGRQATEICERLDLAPATLRTHFQNLRRKLGAHSMLEVVTVALRLGIVAPPHPEAEDRL